MSNVDFFENNEFRLKEIKSLREQNHSKFATLLMSSGIAKSKRSANWIMILVVVISIALTIWIIWSTNAGDTIYVYDKSGKEYTIEEQLKAIESGQKTFNDFR